MNATQLLAHFDRLAEAPNAVPRLRRFILDLAVRGKLVEQDALDEPASTLLKKIESEIARLVKIGEMRKPKALPPIEIEEEPFDVPTGWRWVRIRQVTSDRGQTTPAGEFTYIDVGSINKEAGVLGEHKVLSASDAPSRARKVVGKGDVLYSCVRPTLLNIAVIEDEIRPAPIASTAFAVLNSFGLVLPRYLWIALRSPYLEAIVESGMRGQAYPAINDAEFALLPLALPPLAEQHRIVAKVDELMALCDQLEAAQQERERRRDHLAAASLQRLNQPAADTPPEAQREHARLHLHHLPRLTTRPEHIKAMRQTIRSVAVRGLLKTESASDESAAILANRIELAKARAATHENLKKDKGLRDGLAKEPPFSIPQNWKWVRLQDIFEISRGGSPRPAGDPMYFGGTVPWITVGEVTKDLCKELVGTAKGLTELGAEKSRFIYPGDLLLTNSGATLGVPKISHIKGCINDGVAVLRRFHAEDINDFSYLYLQSQTDEFRRVNQGMGQPNLNTPIIAGWYVPLPPLAEQHRIVAKVDELMALCDQLEAQLTTTQTDSRRLLESILEVALSPA